MEGLFFVVVIIAIGLFVAYTRRWKPEDSDTSIKPRVNGGTSASSNRSEHGYSNNSSNKRSSQTISFDTALGLNEAKRQIVQFAQNQGYDIEDISADGVVIGEPASLATWGFFYPIHLEYREESTRVEIGIKSKFVQVGPTKSRSHEKFANKVKTSLWLAQ